MLKDTFDEKGFFKTKIRNFFLFHRWLPAAQRLEGEYEVPGGGRGSPAGGGGRAAGPGSVPTLAMRRKYGLLGLYTYSINVH